MNTPVFTSVNSSNYGNYSTATPSSHNIMASLADPTQATLSTSVNVMYLTLRVIWSILAIAGNGLTITCITKFTSLQSSTNYLVASLAVGDFIQGLLTPGVILHHVLQNHPSFVPICIIEKTFSAIAVRANFINILWISLDRLFYIAYPLRYPLWQSEKKAGILIGLTWGYLILDTPLIMYFAKVLKPGGVCKISLVINHVLYNGYFASQLFICLIVTLACYIAIARIAYKQGRAIDALNQPFETIESSIYYKQKKIAKMMFTVLASYMLSYIPEYIINVIIQNKRTQITLTMEKVTTLIYYTNSFINPMIYAWKSKEFKAAFKKILGMNNEVNPISVHGT